MFGQISERARNGVKPPGQAISPPRQNGTNVTPSLVLPPCVKLMMRMDGRYGSKTIADAVAMVNAPRRTAEYNGKSHPAYDLEEFELIVVHSL